MVYENDIVPELDEKLRSDFEKNKESNKQIAELDSKLSNGATYRDAEAYAYEMGEALTKTFKDNLSSETLPDGKMYYNIFMRTVDPMIRETYKDATAAAAKAQANVNEAAGLHVKVKEAVLNDDRLHTMVNILTNNDVQYDDVSWVVEDKTTNIIQSAVDDTMKANADFHAKMGMSPKIVREAEAKCCEWCKDLAGTYEYPLDSDEEMVYHRHANCRCVVEYYPGDGRVQNAHDKTWRDVVAEAEKQQRIETDKLIRENAKSNSFSAFNKNADPVYDIYGPIYRSHPDEMDRIIRSAKEKGVEIREGDGIRMAYSPGLHAGQPGQLLISKENSIGAWRHEEQHMNDDYADGFLGFQGLFDVERRCKMEYNAYNKEIEIAIQAGRKDVVDKLRLLCRQEIEQIGGMWDEKKIK